jgi:hypothetical protein
MYVRVCGVVVQGLELRPSVEVSVYQAQVSPSPHIPHPHTTTHKLEMKIERQYIWKQR